MSAVNTREVPHIIIIARFSIDAVLRDAGLLMRPEHSETKANAETRECETEIETETETKNYETETETETSPVKTIAGESNTNRYVSFFITHMRSWSRSNDEPEMDFAFKMISE